MGNQSKGVTATARLRLKAQGFWAAWLQKRQQGVGWVLSRLYGHPVKVAPRHVVALGGVAVLWSWPTENGRTQSGAKMLLMVRPKANPKLKNQPEKQPEKQPDRRARFVSTLGLGKHASLTAALNHTLTQQLGSVFTRLLGADALSPRHIAATPMLTLTDEETGGELPLQLLVWVNELRPNQEAALQLADNLELIWVSEDALDSPQVSPTHRQLWQAIAPTLKANRKLPTLREDGIEVLGPEEATTAPEARKSGKILH